MTEKNQEPQKTDLFNELVELRKKQMKSVGWTPEDNKRVSELQKILEGDNEIPKEQEEAIKRQSSAGFTLDGKDSPEPEITPIERESIRKFHSNLNKQKKYNE